MRRATIKEFYNTIDEMQKAYPFADSKTFIREVSNFQSDEPYGIELRTVDDTTGTKVTLERAYLLDEKTDERAYWKL